MNSALVSTPAAAGDGGQQFAVDLQPESLGAPGLAALAPDLNDASLKSATVNAPNAVRIDGVRRHAKSEVLDKCVQPEEMSAESEGQRKPATRQLNEQRSAGQLRLNPRQPDARNGGQLGGPVRRSRLVTPNKHLSVEAEPRIQVEAIGVRIAD
jgi:hypothetical protein